MMFIYFQSIDLFSTLVGYTNHFNLFIAYSCTKVTHESFRGHLQNIQGVFLIAQEVSNENL